MTLAPYYADDAVTLYHGDSREVLPTLPAHTFDAVCTDPPYASAAATVTTGSGKQVWGGNWGDMSLVTLLAEQVLNSPTLAPEHEVTWFADHLSYAALVPLFFRRYMTIQNIVWDKDRLGMGAYWRKQTEQIIYARTRSAPTFQSTTARDLIRLRPDYASREHPAEKPLPLMIELLRPQGGKHVVDPFAGVGTTLLAARALGRRATGVEIEERYCEITATRLSQGVLDFGGVA
jgi:DNA modification methylase